MKQVESTVQRIPEKLFSCLSGYWTGEKTFGSCGDFQELILVQPVRFDSKQFAFGLHRTREVSEFIVFNTAHPFEAMRGGKETIVFRVAGGEMMSAPYQGSKKYYNRLIQPAQKKVLYKSGVFAALGVVMYTLDRLTRSYHIEKLDKYLGVLDILELQPLTEQSVVELY